MLEIKNKGTLTMSDYDIIVGNVTGSEENSNSDAYKPNENSFYINGLSLKDSKQLTQKEKDIILNVWEELWQMDFFKKSTSYLWGMLNELEQKSILSDVEDKSM